jgi:hypothetical protein
MHPPVDADVYAAFLKELGKDWTFSYLSNAGQRGKRIWPWTHVAYTRILGNSAAMSIMRRFGIDVVRPEPFHDARNFMGAADRYAA